MAARRPLAFLLVAGAWLIAPAVVWRAAAGLGDTLGPALADPRSAHALSLGLVLTCAALGAALAAALPGPAALGPQVVAAPVSRRALAVAAMLPVAAGAVVTAGPTLAALVVALASGAPGGRGAGAALVVVAAAACVGGATVAESLARIARGAALRSNMPAMAWGAVTVALGLDAGARALGARHGVVVTLAALVAGAGSARALAGLVAARPSTIGRRTRPPILSPRRHPRTATVASALAVLSRCRELRTTLVAAATFGVAGVVAGTATGAPAAAGALLGGGSCAIASCFVPLSVRGRIDPGRWVWRLTRRALVATAWASASLALVLSALLPVHVLAVAGRGDGPEVAPQIVAFAVLAWASALAAGALVPRRAGGAADDALSLGAFTVAAVVFGGVVSLLGGRLEAAGAPGIVAAALVLVVVSLATVVVLACSLERV